MSSTERVSERHSAASRGVKATRTASCAGEPVSSSSRHRGVAAHNSARRSASSDAGRLYVEAVLDLYLWLPGTPTRSSRQDRRLAQALYERGIPLALFQAALLLGAARRSFRRADAPPLAPIRTLHYFLPLIEEMLELPPAADYIRYLENKLLPLAEAKLSRRTSPLVRQDRDPSS